MQMLDGITFPDASPCTTPRDGGESATKHRSGKKPPKGDATAEVDDGDDDGVDETDPEWLSAQLNGYKNICEWYRKEVKTLTDEVGRLID